MISIIIPAYDRADLLDETLYSISKQKNIDFEIIVVDDNSSNKEIYNICSKHNVKYYKNDVNSGAQVSRNKGVEVASFNYIAFIDSDDKWETETKLFNQYKILKENLNISVVFTALKYIDIKSKIFNISNLKISNNQLNNNFDKIILNKDIIGTYSSVMIRKKDFLESGKCNIDLPARQDWDLWIRLSKFGNAHCLMDEYTLYRIHDNQISSGVGRKIDGFAQLLINHKKYFFERNSKITFYYHLFKLILLQKFSGVLSEKFNKVCNENSIFFKISSFFLNIILAIPFIKNHFIKKLKTTYLFKGINI